MIRSIKTEEAVHLLSAGQVDVIDVRDQQEWDTGHIPGARLVPLEQLRADPGSALPRDNVVFVCAKGIRSLTAAQLASRFGLVELYNLEGGTLGWARAGLPLAVGE
jgi:rhodanese-related sulfurtransferase